MFCVFQAREGKSALSSQIHWADGFIVVYDISDRSSFLTAKAIVHQIRELHLGTAKRWHHCNLVKTAVLKQEKVRVSHWLWSCSAFWPTGTQTRSYFWWETNRTCATWERCGVKTASVWPLSVTVSSTSCRRPNTTRRWRSYSPRWCKTLAWAARPRSAGGAPAAPNPWPSSSTTSSARGGSPCEEHRSSPEQRHWTEMNPLVRLRIFACVCCRCIYVRKDVCVCDVAPSVWACLLLASTGSRLSWATRPEAFQPKHTTSGKC